MSITVIELSVCIAHSIFFSSRSVWSVESQKAHTIFRDVSLRTRRALWVYKVNGDSALLVLNGKSLNSDSALLVLNGKSLNSDSAFLVLNGTALNSDSAFLVLNCTIFQCCLVKVIRAMICSDCFLSEAFRPFMQCKCMQLGKRTKCSVGASLKSSSLPFYSTSIDRCWCFSQQINYTIHVLRKTEYFPRNYKWHPRKLNSHLSTFSRSILLSSGLY